MEIPGVAWVVYIAVLVCLLLTAVYIVGLFRDMAIGQSSATSDEDLDLIREIRNRDMIADEEFERAKSLIRENIEPLGSESSKATENEDVKKFDQ